MPLYFFNLYNDVVTLDDEGAELVDASAAIAHATGEARAMAAHTVSIGHFTRSHRIDIADHDKIVIDAVRFDEAVEIRD